MDISELKSTNNSQFQHTTDFNVIHPLNGATNMVITIKSAKHPDVRGVLSGLITQIGEESGKLKNPTLTEHQANAIATKIDRLGKRIASLVFVSFKGLKDGKKEVECNEETKADIINNYEWICDQIIEQAVNSQVFFKA